MTNTDENNFQQINKQDSDSNLASDSEDKILTNNTNKPDRSADFTLKDISYDINDPEYVYDYFLNNELFMKMYAEQRSNEKSYNPHLVPDELFSFHKPGWRILKTAIAVFICLMLSLIDIGDNSGVFHAFQACIAAIITLKSNLKQTWIAGLYRLGSTGFGALMGLLSVQIRISFDLPNHSIQNYVIITCLLFLTIWITVLFKATEMTALAAIVFILIALGESSNQATDPREYAFIMSIYRFAYTVVGILVAYLVNWALPPYSRKKNEIDMKK